MNSKDDLPKQITHGVPPQFPKLLHEMLNAAEEKGYAHICSWQPHGLSFAIHDRKALVQNVLKLYFKHHLFASFQRQLNLYGFSRVRRTGDDHKTYYHEHFRRDEPERLELMRRVQYDTKPSMWGPREDPDFNSMYRDQQMSKSDDTTGRCDTDQKKMAASDDPQNSGAATSQVSDHVGEAVQGPASYQSLSSIFPQQYESEQYQQLQTTVQQQQPAILTPEQALAQLTALLTHHQSINSPQYTRNNYPFPQQPTLNMYQSLLSQHQPGFMPESSSQTNNTTQNPGAADLIAALLLQSTQHSNILSSRTPISLEQRPQQIPQMQIDPFAAARLPSFLEQYLLMAGAPVNSPQEIQQHQQQQQIEASSVSTLNQQQQALLLQTLLGAYLNSADASQQQDDGNHRGR